MVPYSALAFGAVGAAALRPGRSTRPLLAIVLLWAVVTLIEWVVGAGSRFDALLGGGGEDVGNPGRAAATTVIAFAALALGGLLASVAGRVAGLVTCAAIAYGAVLGHLLGVAGFYGGAAGAGTAIHTAFGLAAGAVALALQQPEHEPLAWLRRSGAAGLVARVGAAGAVALPLVFIGATRSLAALGLDGVGAVATTTVAAIVATLLALRLLVARIATLEERRVAALAALRESEALRARMFGDVSHELRSPLTVILAEIDLLARGPLADHPDHVGRLRGETVELRRRVDELLALASLQAGASSDRLPTRCDLVALVAREAGRLKAQAALRDVHLELHLPPAVFGNYDERQVSRMVSNLIRNGIKHGNRGGTVRITVELVSDRVVSVIVDDDGPGVAPAERERIFERFRRGVRARADGGAGVGLALAREVARAHGGDVSVQNGPLGGARFIVALPCERPAGPVENATAPVPVEPVRAARDAGTPVVLLIDDHATVLSTLALLLRGRFGVLEAGDADTAVHLLREHRPDVVVTDQVEPSDGAHSVVDQLLEEMGRRPVPVIVMTGDPAGLQRVRRRADVRAVLRKPFAPETLEQEIEDAITRSGA